MSRSIVPQLLACGVTVLVLGAIFMAFAIVGTPQDARRRKADAQRVDHLTKIAESVSQSELTLTDPTTHRPYEYRKIDANTFELCATFETDTIVNRSADESGYNYYDSGNTFRKHHAGRQCFVLPFKRVDSPTSNR